MFVCFFYEIFFFDFSVKQEHYLHTEDFLDAIAENLERKLK